mgnify:FL=1
MGQFSLFLLFLLALDERLAVRAVIAEPGRDSELLLEPEPPECLELLELAPEALELALDFGDH